MEWKRPLCTMLLSISGSVSILSRAMCIYVLNETTLPKIYLFFTAIIFNNIYLTIYFILSDDLEQEKLLFGLESFCGRFSSTRKNCIHLHTVFSSIQYFRCVAIIKDHAQQMAMRTFFYNSIETLFFGEIFLSSCDRAPSSYDFMVPFVCDRNVLLFIYLFIYIILKTR